MRNRMIQNDKSLEDPENAIRCSEMVEVVE